MKDNLSLKDFRNKFKDVGYSHWDCWNPRDYLNTYFLNLGQDSFENLKFLVNELKKFNGKPKKRILDFGSGPTIFAGIAAIPYASTIHMCDYLDSNVNEIKKWLISEKDSFNWSTYIKHILELEGSSTHQEAIQKRSNELKRNTTQVFRSDASLDWPIFSSVKYRYPIVISNFCADSATSSKEVWRAYMKNIFNLVDDRGKILITALRNCKFYKSGNQLFPSANVNEKDLRKVMIESGFDKRSLLIEVKNVPDCAQEGFTTIMCASGTKLMKQEQEALKVFSNLSKKKIIS